MTSPSDLANESGSAIAIIGMACRFPGADSCDQFWQNLRNGVESVSFFSDQELLAAGVLSASLKDPDYVKARGIIRDVDCFDASFFEFSPREAEILDPQQRIFLECASQALEIAGYDPGRYTGLIGVYAGSSLSRYLFNIYSNPAIVDSAGGFQVMIGNDKDHLAARTAYKLNLRGPSVCVQTACSTSLVAVHLACQALLGGDCDMALAGGVSITIPQVSGYRYHQGGILAPDGHCRAFDVEAQGTVNGNGVGIVVLRRLADALEDGDRIEAIIRGSAINNDGGRRLGYTAPCVDGQAAVIASAQAVAGVDPETIDYVEAHGSGTPLGDSVEIAALKQAFGSRSESRHNCAIGSVKTNIGHLDASAGVAGLIKTVLALKHSLIPPSLNFRRPGPEIQLDGSPFYVIEQPQPWPSVERPRRAGVSSFGLGGTNAHVVLESTPKISSSPSGKSRHLLPISAKSAAALDRMCLDLARCLQNDPQQSLADIAFTLQTGRRAFPLRRMFVCGDVRDAVSVLDKSDPGRSMTSELEGIEHPIVFAFPGLGEHYVNMGLGLYRTEEVFRRNVDLCCEILKPYLGVDLCDVLYPDRDKGAKPEPARNGPSSDSRNRIDLRKMLAAFETWQSAEDRKLNEIRLTHPALFVIEYALAQLWLSWGIRPAAMIGYSVGEYVAACLAGVFSLQDALLLVSKRARMIQELPGGAMLAVSGSVGDVMPMLGPSLSVAAVNGPSLCIISGSEDLIAGLETALDSRTIIHRRLQVSHAFHSHMMSPVREAMSEELKGISLGAPKIPFISTVTGTWIGESGATSAAYWIDHICRPVLFADALQEVWKEKYCILLEVGPGQGLTSLASQHPGMDRGAHSALRSMRSVYEQQEDESVLLETLGKLWLAGTEINWDGFWAGERRLRVPLPTYPFERRRYWIEAKKPDPVSGALDEMSGKKPDPADWFYEPIWQQTAAPLTLDERQLTKSRPRWLMFTDAAGLGNRLSERLSASGHEVILVKVAPRFERRGDCLYFINPIAAEHYVELLRELRDEKRLPDRLIHLWGIGEEEKDTSVSLRMTEALDMGFHSLIFLVQAIAQVKGDPALEILAITNSTCRITGDEPLNPAKATILAVCKVTGQEHPQMNCRAIDVRLPRPDTRESDLLTSQLLKEVMTDTTEPAVAYRGESRWTRTYRPVRLEDDMAHQKLLRADGTYLITGGLGGMGLEFAEYLARAVQARLVLIGRSPFPAEREWAHWLESHSGTDETSRKIRKLREIQKTGARVAVFNADVSDERQMRKVIQEVSETFGQVHGIIHAAGISGGGVIALKSKETAAQVLAPKLQGTLVLDRLFGNAELDFFVMCSSLTSVLGGGGQVDYCAANIFLDCFAQARRQGLTISINWDVWRDVGMALKAPIPHHLVDTHGMRLNNALSPQDGIEAFKRILGSGLSQVAVSARNIPSPDRIGGDFFRTVEQASRKLYSSPAHHQRPALSVEYVAPGTKIEDTVAQIWQELLGVEKIGIYDSFFDLGGNSLIAVRLISRLRETLQVELPLQTLLRTTTTQALANLIENVSVKHQRETFLDARKGLNTGKQSTAQSHPESSYIVELQGGSDGRPLFLIHPAGGTVFVYRDLVRELRLDTAVYGIRARGTALGELPLNRIEEMAAGYIAAVRTIQPAGPYQLAGLSQGGMIAFEMARQFYSLDEEVSLLAMFDTPGSAQLPTKPADDAEMLVNMFSDLLSDSLEYMRQLSPEKLELYVLEKLKGRGGLPVDIGVTEARCFLNVWKANVQALENYAPAVFSGRISYFRAAEWLAPNPRHPELAWIPLARRGIEIYEVPGNHHTMIAAPHVSVLAEHLRACMQTRATDSRPRGEHAPRPVVVRGT